MPINDSNTTYMYLYCLEYQSISQYYCAS